MATIYKNQFTQFTIQFAEITATKFWAVITLIEDYDGLKDMAQVQVICEDGETRYIVTGNITEGATLRRLSKLTSIMPHLARITAECMGMITEIKSTSLIDEITQIIDSTMKIENFTQRFKGAVNAAKFNPSEMELL